MSAQISRRELFRRATLYGGSLYLAALLPGPGTVAAARRSAGAVTFSVSQWRTVEAITARIVPGSEGDPGAVEAGCVNFIDKALAHEEAQARSLYQAGLAALETAASAADGRSFSALAPGEQDALLAGLEAGKVKAWPAEAPSPAVFFETVRAHTIIGFLADPRYGGNRDFAGWRVARYPGPRHRRGGYTPEQMAGTAPIRTIWGDEQ